MTEKAPFKIAKPGFLNRFQSKRPATIAGVETLLTALPVLRIADANDFVRLHPSEEEIIGHLSCASCQSRFMARSGTCSI